MASNDFQEVMNDEEESTVSSQQHASLLSDTERLLNPISITGSQVNIVINNPEDNTQRGSIPQGSTDEDAENLGNEFYYYPERKLREDYKVYKGYKMYDGITKEPIAVKIVDTSSKEMEREVKHLTNARHDNIVRFIDCGKCGERDFDRSYIAMELCDKGTLAEIVKDGCSYEYQKVMLLQIMHGVKYIHGLTNVNDGIGIIHRDLKPQNILRSRDKRNMKIIDFGLGKCIDPEKTMVSKCKDTIGTDGWGSPEHYNKGASMSVKSDIFSAGLVFYFVLSNGKHAFEQISTSWKHNICKNVGMDLNGFQCPDAKIAKDLITKMLEHEPDNRPTAEKVLKHPFFWNEEKKLGFILKIKKELHRSKEVKQQMINLQKSAEVVYDNNNWSTQLILSEEMQIKYGIRNPKSKEGPVYQGAHDVHKDKGYDHASISDLIRYIRNLHEHYKQWGNGMEKIFKSDEDIWRFFSSRFPSLFTCAYNAFEEVSKLQEYCKDIVKNEELTTFQPTEENITETAELSNYAQREPQPRIPQELNQQLGNQEVNPERLKDVFQDEVIKAFASMAEFKKFARSKDGLKLEDCDIEEICQDNKQKMGLLKKWKKKMGKDATPERIREIVENYRKKLNVEE